MFSNSSGGAADCSGLLLAALLFVQKKGKKKASGTVFENPSLKDLILLHFKAVLVLVSPRNVLLPSFNIYYLGVVIFPTHTTV